ncbi:MAG: serine hydrolase [Blautia wexlerae]
MRKKNQLKVFILLTVILGLMLAAAGGAYYLLTKETEQLNMQIEALKAENITLMERVNQLQAVFDEKNRLLSSSAETQGTESLKKTVIKEIPAKGLIAIDPGHQGNWVDMSEHELIAPGSSETKAKATTGTTGRFTGIPEFQLNLDISLMLADELRSRGYEVVLAREDNDTAISNAERAIKANESGADFAIRLHANGADSSSANGALTMVGSPDNPYIGHLYEKSNELATDVLNSYLAETGLANAGMQQVDNMTGLNWSTIPSMILEMGFMTNESDDRNMADPVFRHKMVKGIADGIDVYYSKNPTSYTGTVTSLNSEIDSSNLQTLIDNIRSQIVAEAESSGETWAVSVMDLNNGISAGFNGDTKLQSASLIKLFIMAAVYDRVCYPASEEKYISFPESYDGELRELITAMITVSDNNAANEIVSRLGGGDFDAGIKIINNFCIENGYTNTSMGRRFLDSDATSDNYTSANDCMKLVASFYNGTCVNPEASSKMLDAMKNQTKTNKIPAGVNGAQTANKTGELAGDGLGFAENDVAVVWGASGDYILSVMSGNLQFGNQAAIDRIVSLSNAVYSAMGN